MTSPLTTCDVVDAARTDPRLHVIDATVRLDVPRFDGDYRVGTGRAEWLEARIPGSMHVDLTAELLGAVRASHFGRPADDDLVAALTRLGIRDGDHVVTYDRDGGIWSSRLWWMLRAIGVPAQVLDGGWSAWVDGALPVERGAPHAADRGQPGALPLRARPVPGAWTSLADVEQIVAGGREGLLVCALGEASFDGSAPTRYSRRGHIPGSTNLPARDLLDDDGVLLSRPELVARLGPLLKDPRPLVLYCGGGISACLLALALVHVGRTDVSVYDGSLDEWTADPARPVEIGPPRARAAAGVRR